MGEREGEGGTEGETEGEGMGLEVKVYKPPAEAKSAK